VKAATRLSAIGVLGYFGSLFGIQAIYRVMLLRKYRGRGVSPSRRRT